MFNSLIVATDLASAPDRALDVATKLAGLGQLSVEVLTVVPPGANPPHVERRRHASAESTGARLTVAVDENVATAIVEHVRGREGALLVMDTAGAGLVSGVRRSITGDLLGRLPQPVLLLGPSVPSEVPLATSTLVAGIDRTHADGPALSVITSWQRTFGGQPPRVVDVVAASGWPAGTVDQATERRVLDGIVEALASEGVDAAADVLHGADPVTSLLAFAEGLGDPVFLMTSDRWAGGPSHWYSTTRRLVQQSTRPVVVVPSDLAV